MSNIFQDRERYKHNSRLLNVLFVSYLFLYVFQPALLPIKTVHLLTVVNISGALLFSISNRKIVMPIESAKALKTFLPFFAYVLVVIPIHLAFGTPADAIFANIINLLLMMLYLILALMFIIGLYKNCHFNLVSFDDALVWIGFLQLIFVLLAYFFPPIKELFNGFTIKNSKVILFVQALNLQGRSYGLAENLFDGIGCISALIIVITFCKGIEKKNTKLIVLSILMMIIPLLNSRTGLIMAIIGVLFSLMYYQEARHRKRTVLYIVVLIALAFAFVSGYKYLPEETQKWFGRGLNETMVLLREGRVTGIYKELLINDFILPDRILIGMGTSPEMLGFGNVDNGYVQFLWRYGIIGSALFFWAYISMFVRLKRCAQSKNVKCVCIAFLILLFIYTFKMFTINNSAINCITFGYVFYQFEVICYEKQN